MEYQRQAMWVWSDAAINEQAERDVTNHKGGWMTQRTQVKNHWLRGNLKRETESLLKVVQNNSIKKMQDEGQER